MHLPKAVFAVASLLISTSLAQLDDCDQGPFAEPQAFGVPWDKLGGGRFCDTKWKTGAVVTGVEVWANWKHVVGIQLSYSDGSKGPLHGNLEEAQVQTHDKITWDAKSPVDKLQKWTNYWQDSIGGIRIEVEGKKLDVRTDTGSYDGESVLTHSGIILGAEGRSGHWIDTMEWKILSSQVGRATITKMKFPEGLDQWNKEKRGIEQVNLAEIYIQNSNTNGDNKTYTFTESMVKKRSQDITHSRMNTWGMKIDYEVSGKIGIPLFAEGSMKLTTGFSYTRTNSDSDSLTWGDDWSLSWSEGSTIANPLRPGRAVHCKATAITGKFDSDYVGTVEMQLVDGTKYEIEQPGHFDSIGWTRAVSDCKNIPIEEVPELLPDGVELKEGDDVDEESVERRHAMIFHA